MRFGELEIPVIALFGCLCVPFSVNVLFVHLSCI